MIGQTLGRYSIAERIEAGGMAEVYRARDLRRECDVGLKVLSTALLDTECGRGRLRKEALALSRLNHPNIAVVHDYDIAEGVAFVAMELVPGVDLRDRMRAGPFSEKEVITVGVQAADALHAAHAAGVVHENLNPANLRITPEGRLKVLDFGLPRVARPEHRPGLQTETVSSQIAGTIPNTAPEQLRGEPADPRSDVYALCAVLYEMVTGVPPFDARLEALLIDQFVNEAPPPPRACNPRVSAGLEALLLKGLEKDPGRRYQSARALMVDLKRLRAPTVAARAPAPRRGWPSRLPGTRRAGVIVPLVLLTMGLDWLAWRGSLGGPVLSFAPRDWILIADFDNQTGEAVFDTSLTTAFAIGLGQSTYANVVSRARIDEALKRMGRTDAPRINEALAREIGTRAGARGLLAPGIGRVGQHYALSATLVDPLTGTEVRAYLERANDADGILDALGRIAETLRRDLGESLASIRQANRSLPQVTTPSLEALHSYSDGLALSRRGRYREAVVQYKRAIERDPEFAMAHAALGSAYVSFVVNEPARGKEHLDRALALAQRTTERERMSLQITYATNLGELPHAADLYKAYLHRYPDDYGVRFDFAALLREFRRFDEAAAEYEEVLRMSSANASALLNLATCHIQAGRVHDALVAYEKAFVLEPTWKAGENLNHEYGFALMRAGRSSDARRTFGLALASQEERARGLRSLALLDLYGGKYRDAQTRLLEAVRLNQARRRSLSAGRDLLDLAIVREGLGDPEGQLDYLDRAAAELEKVSGWVFLTRVGVAYARAYEVVEAQRILGVAERLLRERDTAARADVLRLEGEILMARGRVAAGIEALTSADLQLGALPELTKESLAHAHERAGNVEAAIGAYEQFLQEYMLGWEPQQAWLGAHYTLARLYAKRGEADKARARLDTLLALWHDADPDLPVLQAARRLRRDLNGRP